MKWERELNGHEVLGMGAVWDRLRNDCWQASWQSLKGMHGEDVVCCGCRLGPNHWRMNEDLYEHCLDTLSPTDALHLESWLSLVGVYHQWSRQNEDRKNKDLVMMCCLQSPFYVALAMAQEPWCLRRVGHHRKVGVKLQVIVGGP